MDRLSAPPGGEALASGKGCAAGVMVVVSADGTEVGRVRAGPDGHFEARLQLLDLPVGRHPVVARCGDRASETSIDLVLATATRPAGSGAVAALLCFFVLLALLLFRSPQAPDRSELPSGPPSHQG
ncbi:MAG: hypothetical protein ACT4PW_07895 [Acidimicrobiia bacterium]